METLPLSKLRPCDANPRKSFDSATIEGLSRSIRMDGLLQNLVVAKPGGKQRKYTIISGERRYRALCLLVESGDLAKDTPVPVIIRDGLSEEETHRIATVENIQREDLPPLEEAEAVTALLRDGMTLEDVASQTGLSEGTIKRRLALSALCDEAKAALAEARIGLAQAEALTLGSEAQQRDLIAEGLERISPGQIKHWLTDEKVNVAAALFPKEKYTGTYTSDLFADAETTYFDDLEQFWALQEAAIDVLSEKYKAEGFDPVEIVEGYGYARWQYRPAREGEKGGVVIQQHNSGLVEMHEGIVNLELDRATAEATAENPFAEPKRRPAYSRPLCEYMAMHKSMAVQYAMMQNPRIAKEVAVVQMIGGRRWQSVVLNMHDCLKRFSDSDTSPATFDAIEEEARSLWKALGQSSDRTEGDICVRLLFSHASPVAWYEAVKKLSNPQLDRLHLLLTTLCFGQDDGNSLDTDEDSLFNRVATDLAVDMREHWTPDTEFLEKRSKDQLQAIIAEAGLETRFGSGAGFKKSELVQAMVRAFREVRSADKPSDKDLTARNWLPEAMLFPAVDPDCATDNEGS